MQLFGWFVIDIVPDLEHRMFPLYVHYCSIKFRFPFFVLALHITLIFPHSTFLVLEGQTSFPLPHYPRMLLFWTCFERFYFSLMFFPRCYVDNANLGPNDSSCDILLHFQWF